MSTQKQVIFLTGSRGMVGSNILEFHKSSEYKWLSPTRAELDLTDYDQVHSFLKKNKPNLIIHAAGKVGGIEANIKNKIEFLVENIDLGRSVVMAAKNLKIPSFLNLASSCIYPRYAANPLVEEMILSGELEPTNEGYALAKIFTMRLCQYISENDSGLSYKTLIPCNLYGKHDKFDPVHSHLIPSVIKKIHNAKVSCESSVVIWGDGTARREFMYVEDFVDLIYKCIENFEKVPKVMNVGLGYDYSVNQYYESIKKIIGWNGKFVHDLSRPVGMTQKLVDIEKLSKFGWKSSINLDQGIRATYNFYLKAIND